MQRNQLIVVAALAALMGFIVGCASVPERHPVPKELSGKTSIPGIPATVRIWGDEKPPFFDALMAASREEIEKEFPAIVGCEHHYLAVSGGGDNGAYGAGLLAGWTAAGTRPEFTIVTGISTGALIAPLAFLGPRYDDVLREMYTTYSTEDLVEERGVLKIITGDSAMDPTPMAKFIAQYFDEKVLEEIAVQHRRGRRLYVGTTDLDAGRPVIWNLGEIAQSGNREALDLMHKLLLASASIPVAFPPVMIEVEADGKTYDEMHVDGGTTSQVVFYPVEIDWQRLVEKLDVRGRPRLYIIRNAHIEPDFETVERNLASIGERTISSLIRTQGIGDLYRLYIQTERDGVDYFMSDIPNDFIEKPTEMFDPVYMKKLYDLGLRQARNGSPWQTTPPGLKDVR